MNDTPFRQRNSILEALEAFRDRDPGILLHSIVAFLYICENEGLSMKELAFLCRLNEATTSRAVHALAAWDAPGALSPTLGLLEARQNPEDRRNRMICLSPGGAALRDDLDAIITAVVPIGPAVR